MVVVSEAARPGALIVASQSARMQKLVGGIPCRLLPIRTYPALGLRTQRELQDSAAGRPAWPGKAEPTAPVQTEAQIADAQ